MTNIATVKSVEGSASTNKTNEASKIMGNNAEEYFSSYGINSFIRVTLKEETEINTVHLSLYRGKERKTKFLIVDQDNKPLEPHIFVSSGESNNAEKFYFKERKVTSLKISFLGNIDNANLETLGANAHIEQRNSDGTIKTVPTYLKSTFITKLSGFNNLVHSTATAASIPPNLQDNTSVQNGQFFSVRNVTVSKEEIDEVDVEELNSRVKQIEELDCKDCVKDNRRCYNCGKQNELERDVCLNCGFLSCDSKSTHYPYVVSRFPVAFNNETGRLEKVKATTKDEHSEHSNTKKAAKPATTAKSKGTSKDDDDDDDDKSSSTNNNSDKKDDNKAVSLSTRTTLTTDNKDNKNKKGELSDTTFL